MPAHGKRSRLTRRQRDEADASIDLFRDAAKITRAMRRAVREALLVHKLLGHSIVVWKDGKVVRLPPEKIPVRVPKRLQRVRSARGR